jgi:hypothetical protein
LGEKDVLLSLSGALFQSEGMESIDKEALD